jgi:hypothetical protein
MTTSCLNKHILYFRDKLVKLALSFSNDFRFGKKSCKCKEADLLILDELIDILCKYKGLEDSYIFAFTINITSITGGVYNLDINLTNGNTVNISVDTSTENTIELAYNLITQSLQFLGFTIKKVNNILYVFINDNIYLNAVVVSDVSAMQVNNISGNWSEFLDKINCISYKELCEIIQILKDKVKTC